MLQPSLSAESLFLANRDNLLHSLCNIINMCNWGIRMDWSKKKMMEMKIVEFKSSRMVHVLVLH